MDSKLFVSCKYPRTITHPVPTKPGEEPPVFHMAAGFMGSVPDWVREHWYFNALCKDGTVTVLVETGSSAVEAAAAQAQSIENQARLDQEKAVKIKEATEAAELEAEVEAAADGLDQVGRKKLIKKKVQEAVKAIEADYATQG